MTESEAIKFMKLFREEWDKNSKTRNAKALDVAIQALEKQIAKKPILKHDVSVMHINRGNQPHEWKRLEDNWHCPKCDSFVGERVYVHSKVHDQRKKKYCDNCGQKLNWESDK